MLIAYRLALAFGYRDADHVLESMETKRFRGWVAYYLAEIITAAPSGNSDEGWVDGSQAQQLIESRWQRP